MKLNEEIKKSVLSEFEKVCGIELSDDFLNQVSSGRQMNAYEFKTAYDILMNARREYTSGIMSYEQYNDFVEAVDNYEKYIASLPEGSETVLFEFHAKGVYIFPSENYWLNGGTIN